MINVDRLRQRFLDLTAINSPPGQEREVARYCAEALRDAGFVCQTDAAGNVIAQKAGTVADAPRIFFSGHTDTVQPTAGLVVREIDEVFYTNGETILGADDKAALAEILEGMEVVAERDLPHGDLQVIFSTGEEVGLLGAKALAKEVVAGSLGFVFDASGETGAIITGAPTHVILEIEITGRASHAGFVPENGVSALQIAARAMNEMRLGRIDPETTANAGILRGGVANNIIPESAYLLLEARSRNVETLREQVSHMRCCLEEAAEYYGGTARIREEEEYHGYTWAEDAPIVRYAADAWRRVEPAGGKEPVLRPTGGGSDANVFNARGIPAVVVSCGYRDAHSVNEHVPLADMVKAAEWAVRIVEVVADSSARG